MGLSCSCDEWDGDGWTYCPPDDFTVLKTKNRRKCCSCGVFINVGSECLKFDRIRMPKSDVEYKIFGDNEIKIASWFMCEKCGEIYLNLEAAGYCINLHDSMHELLVEYHAISGFGEASN